jgi:hypothetical protein
MDWETGTMKASELDAHVDRVQGVLRAVVRRNGPEAVDWQTPDRIAIAREMDESLEPFEESDLRAEMWAKVIGFLLKDGPHPAAVLTRIYCAAKKFQPELICNMSLRDLAILMNTSHETMRDKIERMFDKLQESKGQTAVRMPWQRGNETRRASAKAAEGNANRLGKAKHDRPRPRRKK